MIYRSLVLVAIMVTASACEMLRPYEPQTEKPVIVVEELVEQPEPVKLNHAQLMSNKNVIVYPINGQINQQTLSFPEYRGVVDNTTAGGYTVFDSSVTVYAVEGQGTRPGYLPDYSIPQYTEQYQPRGLVAMPPHHGGWKSVSAPMVKAPAMITPVGERSRPILTSYE